ncbi:methyltransferase family protein [Actinotignum urinale]|uniref:methyltransferase family protein n=1 Tax=Actinotignum urinale TaxID=190146 RepID=UPI0003B69535|nr:isoprenylcysteine carboxylmethyltransferase family protein [Actinotignum urinale]MDY5160072.1 isoprenylcysteine carboxylmethyltransferase family protein [Actinotignum urinale]
MNKAGTSHLPVLGVGPIYVSGIFALTVTASVLSYLGFASNGAIANAWIRLLMIVAGLLVIAEAVIVWCAAVFGSHMVQSVKTGKLMTSGIYAWVRHPVYAAFLLLNCGLLLVQANWWLLALPVIYWVGLSVLMKHTEERWLENKFGDEYTRYAARVNRIFPWPPHSTKSPRES